MIKLIISDLDGTFLNSHGDFNRQLFAEVKDLMHTKGVKFSLCTGKQCERVEELFGDDAHNFWILGDSATRIKHKGEYVYQSLIKNALGLDIINTLEAVRDDHVVIACTPNGAVVKGSIAPHLLDKVRKSYTNVRLVGEYSELTDDFVKITVYDEQGRCHDTKPHLSAFFDKAYIVVSEAAWIDIADAGVHKGTTVERLQEMLGVTPAKTMVFGDGLNDIELMEKGAYSFAMRNAFDETKAVANYITRSNDEDGVMKTIIHMLNLLP
ncbi:MAG: Cof-type HAD-IIB family hydrolase [Tolumonas sp.]